MKIIKFVIQNSLSIFILSLLLLSHLVHAETDIGKDKIDLERFYFIRHGQTDYNKQGRISGRDDIPINDAGVKQALRAAQILKNYDIDIIVCSPMLRTRQTAAIIAKVINKPIVYYDGLKEINWGALEGKKISDVANELKLFDQGLLVVDGLETKKDFQLRIKNSIKDILQKYDNPLIVSHGGVYGNLMEIIGLKFQHIPTCVPYELIPNEDTTKSLFTVQKLD